MRCLRSSFSFRRLPCSRRPTPASHQRRILTHADNIPGYKTLASYPHPRACFRAGHRNMATTNGQHSMNELTSTLQEFGITEVPEFQNSYPTVNPVDIYRSHLTDILAPITGADPNVIYNAIQWTQTLDKGDCIIPVPALRIKGKKPERVAEEVIEQVGMIYVACVYRADSIPSFQNLHSSKSLCLQALSSNSSSSLNPSPSSSYLQSSGKEKLTASTPVMVSETPAILQVVRKRSSSSSPPQTLPNPSMRVTCEAQSLVDSFQTYTKLLAGKLFV